MGIIEIFFYALFGIIVFAFVIRVLAVSCKIIYALAPIIIGIIICLMLVIAFEDINKETEDKNANHIESIKNQSGRALDRK